MQLDYIDEINEYGDNIVRLYDFNSGEADKFMKTVHQTLVLNKEPLELTTIDFIAARNCKLNYHLRQKAILLRFDHCRL